MNRRPIKTRDTSWAAAIAGWLARKRIKPNWISMASVGWAFLAGLAFVSVPHVTGKMAKIALLGAAAACIQLRLLCNLFDGMVAVEGGFQTPSGEVFNDVPDRIADPLILIGAGYSLGCSGWSPVLGWTAGLLSVLTAYVRVLGVGLGVQGLFIGPMAKQHRMAVVTLAALLSIVEIAAGFRQRVLLVALAVIVVGCIATVGRRLRRIVRDLENAG